MAKLDNLIKKLCPNGIKEYTLNEVCSFQNGFAFKSNLFRNEGEKILRITNINDGKISEDNCAYFNINDYKENLEPYKVYQGDIVVAMSGATTGKIGCNYSETIYYLNQRVGVFRPNENMLNKRYLYHWLLSKSTDIYNVSSGTGAQPNLSSIKMMNFKIPVPPLEVQREIVHILDDFTLLSAELSAELKARQEQYEYYSEKLLNENCEENYVRLGDITKTITKGTTPKKFVNKGINFIKTEAFDGMNINKNKLSFVDKETHNGFLKRSILEENDILFTIAGATIGKMVVVKKELLPANTNQALAIIRLRDDINVNYIKFILKSSFMKKYIKKCIKGSAQPNLNLQQLNNFLVPFPNNEKQREIMNILEKFEKICNDISEGLPAEIEARKKQYEYYRDKLLTFKELKVNE